MDDSKPVDMPEYDGYMFNLGEENIDLANRDKKLNDFEIRNFFKNRKDLKEKKLEEKYEQKIEGI